MPLLNPVEVKKKRNAVCKKINKVLSVSHQFFDSKHGLRTNCIFIRIFIDSF